MNQNKKMQNLVGNNKPWYKKKGTIITSSSILGAGVLATAIAVPLVLLSNNETSTIVFDKNIVETNKMLNEADNKNSRIGIWNNFISTLSPSNTPRANSLDSIVRTDAFIKEFINLLTDNLYVTEKGTERGAITQVDVDKIKATISESANLALFKDTTAAVYTELFDFKDSTSMFTFKNKTNNPTIEFSLFMPLPGLDLIYNDNGTVNIKTPATHPNDINSNVRLNIKTFTNPSIRSEKNYYFKANSNIQLPGVIVNKFPTFYSQTITNESSYRQHINKSLADIQSSISNDSTNIKSLSYWNSFAILYYKANVALLKEDLLKATNIGGMYKFLAANAKDASNNAISNTDLEEIKTIAAEGTGATKGDKLGLTKPFIASPSYSTLLLNTTNTTGNKYTLDVNVTKFSYDFKVSNLFLGSDAISITPSLELSATLVKTPTNSTAATTYNIANSTYDVSSLVSLSGSGVLTESGGLAGFFSEITDITNDGAVGPLQVSQLVNGLVNLNSKSQTEQIQFWNTFSSVEANEKKLTASLKGNKILANFITQYVDFTNISGFTTDNASLPTIQKHILESSIENKKNSLVVSTWNFTTDGTSKITLEDSTNGIVYGTNSSIDKFDSITIYLGYETDSIENINFTSNISGGSNISFSQTIGQTSTFSSKEEVIAAAKKRVSIVFEKTTTSDTSKPATLIGYFGQSKNESKQTTKPIIISERIIRGSELITAISQVK
ncbi:MAG: hypothetical protein RR697_03440 [Malacoplasma sp.]